MDTSPASIEYSATNSNSFFRKRYSATYSFLVGLLLFFLPFAELKCTSVTLAANSGIGIALGTQWKIGMLGRSNELMDQVDATLKESGKGSKGDIRTGPNLFAIIAIIAGIFGLIITLSNLKMRSIIGMCTGIFAAIMLIGLMIHFRILLNSSHFNKEKNSEYNYASLVTIQFTVWYYLSLISFGVAAFFSYKHHRIELEDAIANFVDFEFQRQSTAPSQD